jgi:hypothetical protein
MDAINSLILTILELSEKLGNATVKDILDEFLNVLNNRLESLDNADRHLFPTYNKDMSPNWLIHWSNFIINEDRAYLGSSCW